MHAPQDRSIAVIIPSRLEASGKGGLFIEQAIAAVEAQRLPRPMRLSVSVGVDADAQIPAALRERTNVRFVHSQARSQAAAINSAAAASHDHDVIALLEDDDRWEPNFLEAALAALERCDFVSSNQLEVDRDGSCIRVNDFPTPSGWIMSMDLWRSIGPFDETYRWHLDNDWLGRLGQSEARRIHLVESTAPVTVANSMQVRPWIAHVLTQGGPRSTVRRHLSDRPLVTRLVHSGSGMFRIASDPKLSAESQSEYRQLIERYGRIPW